MTPQSVGLAGSSAHDRQAVRPEGPRRASSRELGYDARGRGARRDLPPGDRPRRREEGGHRRRPRRPRRAAASPRSRRRSELEGWNVTSSHGGKATGMVALDGRRRGRRQGGDRQRPGRRAVRGGRRGAPAGLRLAPGARDVRDQGGVRRRGRPGPGARPLPALARRGPGRARSSSGHGLITNIIEASIEATSSRSTSSTAPRSTASTSAFVGRAHGGDLP